ncbi:hypothetical protein PSTT_01336 [Puccinia striiformis]|uniref:Uncharacterized protein n=1 Tax=Puccinia striiformis TaxID=27350 RepID=A0A2S4W3Z6_9BASI|nr:hypothetical protein PSTT_01336 [Puccinia striiformis]
MAEWLQVEVNRRQPLEAKLTAPEAVSIIHSLSAIPVGITTSTKTNWLQTDISENLQSDPMLFTQLNRLLTRAFLDEQNQDKVFKLAEYDEEISNDVHWELSSRFLVPPILEGQCGLSCRIS